MLFIKNTEFSYGQILSILLLQKILIQLLRFHLKKKEYYVKNIYKTGISIFCLGLYFFQILCKKTFHFSWKLPVLGITFVLTEL